MDLLIRGGTVIDPGQFHGRGDVLLRTGKIEAIGESLTLSEKEMSELRIIEAQGLIVAPGFVDLHAHLREPWF